MQDQPLPGRVWPPVLPNHRSLLSLRQPAQQQCCRALHAALHTCMQPTMLRPSTAVPQALPTERGSSEAGTVLHPDDWLVQVGCD